MEKASLVGRWGVKDACPIPVPRSPRLLTGRKRSACLSPFSLPCVGAEGRDIHRAGGMGVIARVLERGLQGPGIAGARRIRVSKSRQRIGARCGLGWLVAMEDCLQALREQEQQDAHLQPTRQWSWYVCGPAACVVDWF